MAKTSQLPGFAEKRKILFGSRTSPEKMRETGERFMEARRFDDALEFFARCEANDRVRRVAAHAMDTGDTALFMRAKRVLREEATEAEWTELAATAERLRKPMMAYVAHRQAGHEEEAARLREQVFGSEGPGDGAAEGTGTEGSGREDAE
jgi:hypothetical protein